MKASYLDILKSGKSTSSTQEYYSKVTEIQSLYEKTDPNHLCKLLFDTMLKKTHPLYLKPNNGNFKSPFNQHVHLLNTLIRETQTVAEINESLKQQISQLNECIMELLADKMKLEDQRNYSEFASRVCFKIINWYNYGDSVEIDNDDASEVKSEILFKQRNKIFYKANQDRIIFRAQLQTLQLHQQFYLLIQNKFGISSIEFEDLMEIKDERNPIFRSDFGEVQNKTQKLEILNDCESKLMFISPSFEKYRSSLYKAISILREE